MSVATRLAGQVESFAAAIGASLPVEVEPYVAEASIDTIRHFARAYGDGNPLFGDEEYATRSVRGGIIAPPLFALATGTPEPVRVEPELAQALTAVRAVPFRVAGDEWELVAPVRPGMRLRRRDTLHQVQVDDRGEVSLTIRSSYSHDDTVLVAHDRTRSHGAADGIGTPRAGRARATYSEEEITAIEEAIEGYRRRGAAPRYVEDVIPGMALPPLVKGPLTLTDMVAYRAGVGPGPFGVEPLELGLQNRRVRPKFYSRNEIGAYEPQERVHWDEAHAQAGGHPTAWDYTHTRLTWATQLLTDWIGDAGWLARLSFGLHHLNYLGDTHWMTGEVGEVDGNRVEVAFVGSNQQGETTCSGRAEVLLPRRGQAIAPAG